MPRKVGQIRLTLHLWLTGTNTQKLIPCFFLEHQQSCGASVLFNSFNIVKLYFETTVDDAQLRIASFYRFHIYQHVLFNISTLFTPFVYI